MDQGMNGSAEASMRGGMSVPTAAARGAAAVAGKGGASSACLAGVTAVLLSAFPAAAAEFTPADSGWVSLFNGTDFKGLYSRMYNAPVTNYPTIDPIFTIRYQNTDSVEIYVKAGGGELGTIRTDYKHYRMRIQYRFEQDRGLNAGFLYAVDESYPRMGGDGTTARGNWPRSIECQMKQGEGGDAFSIQQVTFDTRVTANHWAENGTPIKVCEFGCNGRNFQAFPRLDKHTEWNDMEVVVRGRDSAFHNVNGQTVFKLWNLRITDRSGKDLQAWDSGAVGLEAENAIVHYRRWEIMELPATGPHFLNRLFLDAPKTGETLPAGRSFTVRWRSLGNAKKVSLKYDAGQGWKTLADSVENNGSYAWNVPADLGSTVRVKILASEAWVRPDSSGSIQVTTGLVRLPNAGRAFAWRGRLLPLDGVPASARLRIADVTGRTIREIPVGEGPADLAWDGKDASGRPVPAGYYFAGFAGSPARMRLSVF